MDKQLTGQSCAKLIILRGDQHRVYDLKDPVTTIGRAPDNSLWLDDPNMSRRHCEVRQQNGRYIAKDLGSFNGTFINNLSMSEQVLKPGDRLQFGSTSAYFIPVEGQQIGEEVVGSGTIAGSMPAGATASDGVTAEQADEAREATSRKLRNFMALLEIVKAVSSELDTNRLLQTIVGKAIDLIHAERGFCVLIEDGKRVFRVARTKNGDPIADPEKQISGSVLDGVTTSGEPVLTINAQQDLGGFMSIVALEVRSLICVPLKVKEKTRGAIYVDSHVAQREFTDESMNLLQAFADQAAIALDNARLYDEVVESREMEKKIRRIFQKYVPADVVREVLNIKEGTRLSSRQVATVLFSDIRAFTSMSERMAPEEVVSFLNEYLKRMVDIVIEEGGIVDKFVGDAVMAVFGAPVTRPDDPVRAVRAGLRMLEELARFNAERQAAGKDPIRIGVGIHTGPLIAGNIGSDKKMEYTVIGDTVNLSSRIQDLNKEFKTAILVSQQTQDAVAQHFSMRPMPPIAIKGKTGLFQVYEVLGAGKGGGPGIETFDIELSSPAAAMHDAAAEPLLVIGHRRPDLDSISAALGYAELLRAQGTAANAGRCGGLDEQSEFALGRFGLDAPALVLDVAPTFGQVARRATPLAPEAPLAAAFAVIAAGGRAVPVVGADGSPLALLDANACVRLIGRAGAAAGPALSEAGIRLGAARASGPCLDPEAQAPPVYPAADRVSDHRAAIARAEADDFLVVDADGRYVGVATRAAVLAPPRRRLVLVDHNELQQAVAGADEADIVEVIDHHRLGTWQTRQPIPFTVDPVGSTATLVEERFGRAAVALPAPIAGLLLSGILSDTLAFRSPTCTPRDEAAARRLAAQAGIADLEAFGDEVVAAGAGLGTRPADDIVAEDYKEYEVRAGRLVIAQAEVKTLTEAASRAPDLLPALERLRDKRSAALALLMLTDVVRGRSRLLAAGEPRLIARLTYPRLADGTMEAGSIVSRKKELVPAVLAALE